MQAVEDIHVIGPGRAPAETVKALQAIDPKAELVHLEGKRWWLGIREPNPAAQDPLELEHARFYASRRPVIDDPAERALAEQELSREFLMRQIMARGFKPVALYTVERGDFTEVVEDFRIRDFNWRTKSPEQLAKELREATSIEHLNRSRVVEWGKKAAECAAEAFRFVFKGSRGNQSKVRRRARRKP